MAPTRTPVLSGLVLAGLACSVACGGTEKFTMGRLAVQAMPPAASSASDSFSTPPSDPPPPPRTVRRAPPPPPPPAELAPVRDDDFDESPDPVSSSVVIRGERIEIREKVQFETWKAEIRRGSYGLLDEIAELLKRNGHVRKVEIQGHTSVTKRDRERLRPLSQRRANAVRRYLIRRGVEASRLVARGYGYKRPIADNATASGRSANRRVEFVILEQGVPSSSGSSSFDNSFSPPPSSPPPSPPPPASPPPDDFGDGDFQDDDEFEDDEDFESDEDF
ncbi:MAG: OmpA family protein [Myxococcota bacterium]